MNQTSYRTALPRTILAVFPACQISVTPRYAAISGRGFDTPLYQVSINEQELNLHPCLGCFHPLEEHRPFWSLPAQGLPSLHNAPPEGG
jgi:hypothetical protein